MKRLILLFFLSATCYAQAPLSRLNGRVVDTQNKPIQYASILVNDGNVNTYSNENGEFSLRGSQLERDLITLKVSFVGMQSISRVIKKADFAQPQLFVVEQLSLTLSNVVVSSERKKSDISNSAILFDRQAIEQVQAFSLMDVLNNLPGKKMSAPDLQYLQNITLRSASAGSDPTQKANNSLGVAIYLDGFRQANDANMQTRNVGLRNMTGGAIGNRRDPDVGNPQYDSPFGGLDIRNIPADNIESIEVVSGVASAKYSEMTDGAIIIQRKAGVTPYQFNMRLNGTSTNYSLSKGVSLGNKAGAMNFNLNYLNSIQDPRNSIKNYRRINGGLMWTTNFLPNLRNTISADYSYKKDNAKLDPDDNRLISTRSLDRRISFTNRTSLKLENPFIKNISLGLSYDKGYSNSYSSYYVNSAVRGVADKDTTGIYEGYFIPGNYTSIENIIGEPYNYSANLSIDNDFATGRISHALSVGASFYAAGNSGPGIIADPDFPPVNIGSMMKSERPYNFDLQQDIVNGGFYLQDQMRYTLFNRELTANAGLRYDIQNGAASFQPRINTSYKLSKHWSLRAAYGISSKAPGMAQRYPAPTYFDIPLLSLYAASGKVTESVYLVYTDKRVHDNSTLKPSRSSQIELGVAADYKFFSTSLYGYMKKNRDGFNTTATVVEFVLPKYDTVFVTGQKPVYLPNGKFTTYTGLKDNVIGNSAKSDNFGIEWSVSTSKIRAIQTSVTMNTSFSYSNYENVGYATQQVGISLIESGGKAHYGIYPATKSSNLDISTKISTDTHIPKLGFIVSVAADIYWKNRSRTLGRSTEPIAYLDRSGNYIPIHNFDKSNPDYGYLALENGDANNVQSPPFVYGNMSLRIAKEMNKKFRISVYANNFLNLLPTYYNPAILSYTTYNSMVNVGGEISFKF